MNTYYDFLEKIHPYLKSVRKLNTHISYDLTFSDRWVLPKTKSQVIEVVKNGNENGNIQLSFVCPINRVNVNEIEKLIDNIIKSNREREEKEKLFRSKVQELKGIFEKQKLEDLKGLKFDVDEITSIINSNGEEDNGPRDSKGTTTIEDSAKKVD
jgi:hypothetical protein